MNVILSRRVENIIIFDVGVLNLLLTHRRKPTNEWIVS